MNVFIFSWNQSRRGIKLALLLFIIMGSITSVYAQQNGSVSGIITDPETSEPLISATVVIEGTKHVALSDTDGKYTFPSLAPGNYTISATYVGFKKYTEQFTLTSGQKKTINIALIPRTELTEVVVTALGIKRDEKALGYAVSKLSSDDVTKAMPNNWSDALSGRVAGVNLVNSGGPVGSSKIVLRGENSLDGNSSALIIVDGVIISESSGRRTGSGSTYNTSGDTSVDFGSSLSDINPDDIEDISILKGPGAAALYGARGANGAIIITTKQGRKVPGIGITINSNIDFETINNWPDYQYEYGQGDGTHNWYSYDRSVDGASTRSTSSAWGPRFNENTSYFQYDPVTQTQGKTRTPWVAYPNNRKDFFRTGVTYTNSVAFQGGNDKAGIRFSYTNRTNNWIMENTGYSRNTLALSVNYKLTDKLKVDSKINYVNKSSDNLPSMGYGNSSIMYFIRGIVPNADINWYKDYWKLGRENQEISRPFSSLIDNPYAILYEMTNSSYRNQVSGNIAVTYDIIKDLSVLVRATTDLSTEKREQKRPYDTQGNRNGMYRRQNITSQETTIEFLAQYKKTWDRFGLNASLGGQRMDNRYNKDDLRVNDLLFPDVYTLANGQNIPISDPYLSRYSVNSIYGMLALNYSFIYLDITGRNDWFSTLARPVPPSTNNCSVFYPSFNLSGVLTEAMKFPEQVSFLKVRGSWSKVGSGGTTPYRTSYTYVSESSSGFNAGLSNPTVLPNYDLKPLKTISYEVGIDARLFNNRLKLDLSAYKNNTSDQIIRANLDRSTGYSAIILNAGEVQNKGIEAQVEGVIIDGKKDELFLSSFMTYSINRNKLVRLTDNLTVYNIYNSARGSLVAYPGGSLGAIYGLGYNRAPKGSTIENPDGSTTDISGQIIYDAQGYPTMTDSTIYVGDTNPKWKGSFGMNIRYKNFSFSFLLDGQFGGMGYSLTHATMMEMGTSTKTLPGRYNGIVGEGVVKNSDGTYRWNTTLATNIPTYYQKHYDRSNVEANTFRTDYIKLREVRLDYKIPKAFLKKFKIESLEVGVYGRNLFTITKWPAYDPEFGDISGSDIVAGFENAQFPSTRVIGSNIKLSF